MLHRPYYTNRVMNKQYITDGQMVSCYLDFSVVVCDTYLQNCLFVLDATICLNTWKQYSLGADSSCVISICSLSSFQLNVIVT